MMTILFAVFALVAFMERASNDLLVEQREVLTRRLRIEAYSALEVTLAVLSEFSQAGQGLRSPAEGWADPLTFAGYTPSEGRVVAITFEDESGKLSLPRANTQVLLNLFKHWQLLQPDAEALADALMGWMRKEHTYSTGLNPNYDQGALPFEEPRRSLKSFSELAAIEKVRDKFFDEQGRPNDLWKRFADTVSLLDFQRPNINGAKPDALAALGQFDPSQQQNISDYLRGTGQFATQGPQFFQNPAEATRIALGSTGDTAGFGATISALRITVTVIEGKTQFRLAATIAPPNGATTVQTNATAQRTSASASAQNASQRQNQPNAQNANQRTPAPRAGQNQTQDRNLRYPFTLLEIRENDAIPPAPPPPPPDQLL